MNNVLNHSRHGALLALSLGFLSPGSARAVTYSVDGGSPAAALGDTNAGWSAVALNHFTAVAGGQNITSVSVLFGVPETI